MTISPEKRSEINQKNGRNRWKNHVPKEKKYGDLPKASDWSGRRVRLRAGYHARGGVYIPQGTEMTVIKAYGGLDLVKAENCPYCGCGQRNIVDRVPYDQVRLIPDCYANDIQETMQADEQGFEPV